VQSSVLHLQVPPPQPAIQPFLSSPAAALRLALSCESGEAAAAGDSGRLRGIARGAAKPACTAGGAPGAPSLPASESAAGERGCERASTVEPPSNPPAARGDGAGGRGASRRDIRKKLARKWG